MCKTILLPIDFRSESLNPAKKAIEDHPNEKLNILLVHGIHASDSITDLLYFSKSAIIEKLTTPEFDEACNLLVNLYEKQINSLKIELFTGFTQAAFNNFVSAQKIDKIYFSAAAKKTFKSKMSADMTSYLQKVKLEKVELPASSPAYEADSNFAPQISIIK